MTPPPGKFKGVIYDLDGTLIDSAPDIAAAVNGAIVKRGYAAIPVPDVERMVGGGGRNVCKLALDVVGADSSDQELLEATIQDFFEYYREHPVVHTTVFPGTREGLGALQAAGYQQGMCTNKSQKVMELVLAGLDLQDFFAPAIGGDATPHHKPDPRHLLHVLDEMGLKPAEVAFVGDTVVDLHTAQGAGVGRFFSVAWAREDAKEAGYSTDLARIADLPALLQRQ